MSLQTLTTKDVTAAFQISEKSVYRMVADGSLRAYKVGRSLRFKPADVEKAMVPVKTYTGSKAGDDID